MSEPWSLNPVLALERLQVIAALLVRVRNEALELHDPASGEGPWSLGTRVYERTMRAIELAMPDCPWLDCERLGLYFIFSIEGLPLRFYRADSEDITPQQMKTKKIRTGEHKRRQLSLFAESDDSRDWFWRIRVETDEEQRVLRIVIHRATEDGDLRDEFVIPHDRAVPALASMAPPREAVDLAPPEVEFRTDGEDENAEPPEMTDLKVEGNDAG